MNTEQREARLRDTLRQLRVDLNADLERVRGDEPLLALERRAAELTRYLDDLDAQLERHQSSAVITLVGSTGAGKSTLLNALVGADVARPGTDRPTTTRPVIYKPRSADVAALIDGLDGVEVADYNPALESATGPTRWTEQVLIDAPDTNSVAIAHHAQVALLAERSDALVVVAHRQSVAELASVEFVDAFAGRRDLCFVLNRADELTDAAAEELLGQLRSLTEERWGLEAAPIFVTSAANALAAIEDGRDPVAEVPGWGALTEHLGELVRTGRLGRVRRDNALGTCARIGALAGEVRQQIDPELERLEQLARTAVAAFRARVEAELGERLALRRRDISQLLWNETSRHWEGPGGWALRAGGLSGLGLGAGALVARRNPLLAAGAAVGAVALDRAQGALRERRLERTSGLVPTAHELEGWYRESFAEARLANQRLTGQPEAHGLSNPVALSAAATEAVEAAWARLVERDLATAAARGARWYLRLPIDLPVFALVGWVVYQAGLGLWKGEPTGLDPLIDTAIVLLAWLFLARTLVRWILSGLGRGLVAGVATQAEAALERTEEVALAPLAERLAERRAALARLAELEPAWRAELHAPPVASEERSAP